MKDTMMVPTAMTTMAAAMGIWCDVLTACSVCPPTIELTTDHPTHAMQLRITGIKAVK